MKEKYDKEILPGLAEKFGRSNRLSLPRLQKIVVNMGVGKAISEKKYLEEALDAMKQITGQKPLIDVEPQVDCQFQAPRKLAHRVQGHVAGQTDVGISRSADVAGVAAGPRLSRAGPERLRRPGEL